VLPTGGGKTHTKSNLIAQMKLVTMCIAHRQELVLQISESLAMAGITHRVIAPHLVVRFCAQRHIDLFKRSYIDANADVAVAGVQTLLRRQDTFRTFASRVRLSVWASRRLRYGAIVAHWTVFSIRS
jgi:superfamily II DNA or RNA helicase